MRTSKTDDSSIKAKTECSIAGCRSLHGRHQIMNAGLAIAALLHNDAGFDVPEQAINDGLGSARWPARMSRLNGWPARASGGRCNRTLAGRWA